MRDNDEENVIFASHRRRFFLAFLRDSVIFLLVNFGPDHIEGGVGGGQLFQPGGWIPRSSLRKALLPILPRPKEKPCHSFPVPPFPMWEVFTTGSFHPGRLSEGGGGDGKSSASRRGLGVGVGVRWTQPPPQVCTNLDPRHPRDRHTQRRERGTAEFIVSKHYSLLRGEGTAE